MIISTRWFWALLLSTHLRCFCASLRGGDDRNDNEEAIFVLDEAQDATFLLKVTEYGDRSALGLSVENAEGGNRRPRKRTRNIQLSDGTIYEVKNARAGWANDLISGNNNLHIPRGVIMSSNGTIDMKGQAIILSDMVGQEEKGLFDRNLNEDDSPATPIRVRQLQSVGTRTVLVARVILDDGAYDAADPTGLSNDVFGNGVDPINLKSQFAACSANQLLFEMTPNRVMSSNPNDGGTTDINNGVVDIKVNLSKSIGDNVIRNAVTTKINSVFGVRSPVELADHVMYCLPKGSVSGIAYAYINSWSSVFSNEWCNYVSTQMHEIGHNLGYGHSNELGTYQDQTGMMGYSYSADDFPRMCFNAAKSWQSQWYTSKSIIVDPSADVGYCFEGRLYGIADYSNPASSVVLVKIDDSSSTDIYVAFNRKIGINLETVEAVNQVTVVSASGEGISYSESELLAKLGAGGVWRGVIDDKSMTVHVLSINTSVSPAYATVRISENSRVCLPDNTKSIAPTRVPTLRPSASPTSAPSTVSPSSASPTTHPYSASPTGVPTIRPSTIPTFTPSSTAPSTTSLPSTSVYPTISTDATNAPTMQPKCYFHFFRWCFLKL